MSSPSVTMVELDGALGIVPISAGKLQAILGDAQSGPFNQPAAWADVTAFKATYGVSGPAVEEACYSIENYGKPIVFVRTQRTTLGSTSNLVTSGVTGTSAVTIDGSVPPVDDFEMVLTVVAGGTIGVSGITLTWSRDGGRTTSVVTALGTANSFTPPNSGVKFNFGAGTLVAKDVVTVVAHAPKWADSDLSLALDALKTSTLPWEYATIMGDATGTDLDAVELKFNGMHNQGKHRWYEMHFRMPNVGESDATYQAAFSTAFSSHATTSGEVTAGACKALSAISDMRYRRPVLYSVAPVYASISEEKDAAKISLGPLPGTQIRDDNGNLDEHDEFEEPGLDDMRATTLRTWPGRDGVFINNPRILCPAGSDFILVQFRRVMNIARTALTAYLETRLSEDIIVDAKTGFITEPEAVDIESGANAAVAAALLTVPKASSALFVLSRNDNLLSTQTLHYRERIVPLGYAKAIVGDIGFNNPALRAVVA